MPRTSLNPPLTALLLGAAFLAASAAAPAVAQEQSPYEQCLGKAKGGPASLACAKAELTRQEARLKAAEAKLGPTLKPAAKPLFAAANEAWQKFRDAQCTWDRANAAQGENADFAETDCKVAITEARASELEGRAAPPEEDQDKK